MGSAATRERASVCLQSAITPKQSDAGWFLLQTRAKQEQRARTHLENQGFHCFLPEIDTQVRQGGRLTVRREALFPGYLFIKLSQIADNWAPIRSTRGVLRIVSFSHTGPTRVGAALVESIQRRVALPANTPSTIFKRGEKVRIAEGAFADVEAIFECFSGEERVCVLLKMMQTEQRVSFPLRSVARLA